MSKNYSNLYSWTWRKPQANIFCLRNIEKCVKNHFCILRLAKCYRQSFTDPKSSSDLSFQDPEAEKILECT